jgi:hypothetical protein
VDNKREEETMYDKNRLVAMLDGSEAARYVAVRLFAIVLQCEFATLPGVMLRRLGNTAQELAELITNGEEIPAELWTVFDSECDAIKKKYAKWR